MREINLFRFLSNLSSIERADLILSILVHLPMPVVNTSAYISQKTLNDADSLKKIGVRFASSVKQVNFLFLISTHRGP